MGPLWGSVSLLDQEDFILEHPGQEDLQIIKKVGRVGICPKGEAGGGVGEEHILGSGFLRLDQAIAGTASAKGGDGDSIMVVRGQLGGKLFRSRRADDDGFLSNRFSHNF